MLGFLRVLFIVAAVILVISIVVYAIFSHKGGGRK